VNTPAHLIIGAAAFARPASRLVSVAAVLGALVPDLSLYLLVGWSLHIAHVPPRTVFGEYYFSPEWQAVFAVDNSFILWGVGLAVAVWASRPAPIAFFGAGFLHLMCDFPLHNEDARRHFWPLSDWVFRSPFSYWDRDRHGDIIGTLEIALCVVLAVILWRRFTGWPARALILAGLCAELLPGALFRLMLH
jgi:membrane-bound metal-dependent hydrolase YbcI (DUF457 family)